MQEVDHDRPLPYHQCDRPEFDSSAMSENDYWYRIEDGTLGPGESWQVSNPRPLCEESWPVRAAWRFMGNGRAPIGLVLEIVDPVGGATYRTDHTTVVATKGGRPVWIRQCTNVGGPEAHGTWVLRVTNTGPVAVPLRVAASVAHFEFPIQQCPNWLTVLSNHGI